MIDHAFQKDPFGRDTCDRAVAGPAGVRTCGYPAHEHRAADHLDAFLGGVERSVPPVSDKTDGGKLRWDLLPWDQVRDVVAVLTAALGPPKNYPEHGWKGVPKARSRYFAAAVRHLFDWWGGERLDPQLKLPHLACAACCVLFLMWHDDQQETTK